MVCFVDLLNFLVSLPSRVANPLKFATTNLRQVDEDVLQAGPGHFLRFYRESRFLDIFQYFGFADIPLTYDSDLVVIQQEGLVFRERLGNRVYWFGERDIEIVLV